VPFCINVQRKPNLFPRRDRTRALETRSSNANTRTSGRSLGLLNKRVENVENSLFLPCIRYLVLFISAMGVTALCISSDSHWTSLAGWGERERRVSGLDSLELSKSQKWDSAERSTAKRCFSVHVQRPTMHFCVSMLNSALRACVYM